MGLAGFDLESSANFCRCDSNNGSRRDQDRRHGQRGIVLAVHEALDVPVKFIGVGEKATDLEAFDPKTFAREVLEG